MDKKCDFVLHIAQKSEQCYDSIRYTIMTSLLQEASRIRDDAKKTKDRAVALLDSADDLAQDVEDSEDQVKNLDVQASSDADLAQNVGNLMIVFQEQFQGHLIQI